MPCEANVGLSVINPRGNGGAAVESYAFLLRLP